MLTSSNSTVAQEVKIRFGENSMFGCTLPLTRQELASLCKGDSLPNGFAGYLNLLPIGSAVGNNVARNVARWTRIAAFGNVPLDAQDAADWVKVEERPRSEALEFSDSSASQKASNSTCTGAVVGVDLEVIYSPFGEVGNPQMKVVGAQISQRLGVLAYTLAEPTKRQGFQFTYSVRFFKTDSENLEIQVPPRPQLPLSLPPDLFYPFTIGRAGMRTLHPVAMIGLIALFNLRTQC